MRASPARLESSGLQPCQFLHYKMTVADEFYFGGGRAAGIKKRRVAQPFLTERPVEGWGLLLLFLFQSSGKRPVVGFVDYFIQEVCCLDVLFEQVIFWL